MFSRLFDDAAIFPPGDAPMSEAVPAHADHASAWYHDIVGPFVCSDRRWAELVACLSPGRLELSLVVTSGPPAVAVAVAAAVSAAPAAPRVVLRAVEVPVHPAELTEAVRVLAGLPSDVLCYVELPLGSSLL